MRHKSKGLLAVVALCAATGTAHAQMSDGVPG